MAIYHLSAKPISRGTGRSATGAAAYRAGVEIVDERTGLVHDYTRKSGVLHSELVLPGGGTADRSEFWNSVEKHHKRGDAVLVREIEISLPSKLAAEHRKALAVSYARELAERYGVAADVAIHAPRTITDRELEKRPEQHYETDPKTGRRHNGNYHAHIMLSACSVQIDGTLGKKAVELDPIHCQRAKIENMVDRERARWAELANAELQKHGIDTRIDHRTLEAQGIEREPARHLGPAAAAIERRTAEPSRIRLDWEYESMTRLTSARKKGDAERDIKAIDRSILDLSGNVETAKRERDRLLAEKSSIPSPRQLEAGMAAAREQFAQHKEMQAGMNDARAAYAQFKAEQIAKQAAAEQAAERAEAAELKLSRSKSHNYEPDFGP